MLPEEPWDAVKFRVWLAKGAAPGLLALFLRGPGEECLCLRVDMEDVQATLRMRPRAVDGRGCLQARGWGGEWWPGVSRSRGGMTSSLVRLRLARGGEEFPAPQMCGKGLALWGCRGRDYLIPYFLPH